MPLQAPTPAPCRAFSRHRTRRPCARERNLQAALDAAVPGTTIRLASGATYTGNFILRNKTGAGVITVRAADDVTLPPRQRVGPTSAAVMAKLQAPAGTTPILTAEDGASNYTLIGLEFAGNATTPGATLVQIGRLDMKLAAQTPTDIILRPRIRACRSGRRWSPRARVERRERPGPELIYQRLLGGGARQPGGCDLRRARTAAGPEQLSRGKR